MESVFWYDMPSGRIGIAADGQSVTAVLIRRGASPLPEKETPLIREAASQLHEYFAGKRKCFNLPCLLRGTKFQQQVWQSLQTIPYAETREYAQIAAEMGHPRACRAVGQANALNPLAIIVPCHRVIGAKGKLTGYGGGMEMKDYLLNLEQKYRLG